MDKGALLVELYKAGISVEKWGTGGAKTVDHLLEEINSSETQLTPMHDGRLMRAVQVVGLTVMYRDGERTLTLVEDKQGFSDGRERKRKLETSLGEKMFFNEDPTDGARRVLREELHITEELDLKFSTINTPPPRESPSYPGLLTRYRFWNYRVELPARVFRPEGYVEVQGDKTTYFVWR